MNITYATKEEIEKLIKDGWYVDVIQSGETRMLIKDSND